MVEIGSFLSPDLIDKFLKMNEKLLGIKGYIKQKSKDTFEIYFEGNKSSIEKARKIFTEAMNLVKDKGEIVLKRTQQLAQNTCKDFKVAIKQLDRDLRDDGTEVEKSLQIKAKQKRGKTVEKSVEKIVEKKVGKFEDD